MGTLMDNNSAESVDLIERARAGDREALNALLARHRGRLRRMVEIRLDTRLQGRLNASDVIQEAYVEVAERLQEYLRDPKLPLFLRLRLVVGERLIRLHRHHLGTQMRDAGREVSLYRGALPAASSAALAAQLLGRHTSPTQAVVRAERILRVQEALNAIPRDLVTIVHKASDREPGRRYATAGELAAAGQRTDEPPLDDAAKAKLRSQGLDWLKAELTAWRKLLDSGPPETRPAIVQTLRSWDQDSDLASIRDAQALAKLPAEEQRAFTQLWADVAELLKKAEEKPK